MENKKRQIPKDEKQQKTITIWLVDDNIQFTTILQESFKSHPGFCCSRIFQSGNEVLNYLENDVEPPNVILLDINMPGISGIETLAQLKLITPETHVLMLTVNLQDENIQHALELGASGYLLKSSSVDEIVHSIDVALKGGIPLDPFVVPRVLALLNNQDCNKQQTVLTEREREIVQLIANGLSTQQIAEKLFLSEHTVRTHIKKIFQKLDVHTRHHLVSKAIREKII